MKEIRLHGRGGLGVVKASQLVVRAAVEGGLYGQSIPAFGVERKGSPVFGYLRLSHTPIRRRMQVYTPDILLILDDSLITSPDTYAGLKDGGMIIINTKKAVEDLHVSKETGTVVTVDATTISEELLGRNMPNTAMLGAFTAATGLVDIERLLQDIAQTFGTINRTAAEKAAASIQIHRL